MDTTTELFKVLKNYTPPEEEQEIVKAPTPIEEPGETGLGFSGTTGRSKTNNNPGNLTYAKYYAEKYGAELEPPSKKGERKFLKFKTMEDGYNALKDQISIDANRGHTLKSFVYKFSPPSENKTDYLVNHYAKRTGVSPDTPLSEVDLDKLAKTMAFLESSTTVAGNAQDPTKKVVALLEDRIANPPPPEPTMLAKAGSAVVDALSPSQAEAGVIPLKGAENKLLATVTKILGRAPQESRGLLKENPLVSPLTGLAEIEDLRLVAGTPYYGGVSIPEKAGAWIGEKFHTGAEGFTVLDKNGRWLSEPFKTREEAEKFLTEGTKAEREVRRPKYQIEGFHKVSAPQQRPNGATQWFPIDEAMDEKEAIDAINRWTNSASMKNKDLKKLFGIGAAAVGTAAVASQAEAGQDPTSQLQALLEGNEQAKQSKLEQKQNLVTDEEKTSSQFLKEMLENPQAKTQKPVDGKLAVPAYQMPGEDPILTKTPTVVIPNDIKDEDEPGLIRKYGPDAALVIGAGLLSTLAFGQVELTPVIYTLLHGATTGLIYQGIKETGIASPLGVHTPEEGSGWLGYTGAAGVVERMGEEALSFAALDYLTPKLWKAMKTASAARLKPLEAVGEKAWDIVSVIPGKGPLANAALGAGAGAAAGALNDLDEPLEGAAKGAILGGAALGIGSGIAKLAGTTLKDALQPAIERLRQDMPNVAATFRKGRVMKDLTTEAGEVLGRETRAMSFAEREELLKALATDQKPTTPAVVEAHDRLMKVLTDTTETKYQEAFKEKLSKLLKKDISAVPESMGAVAEDTIKSLDTALGPNAKLKDMRKAVKNVLEDPMVDDGVKAYVRDLYDLHLEVPSEIARAGNYAMTEQILSKLQKNPAVFSSELKEGYVISKHPSISGLNVLKDVELELKSMAKMEHLGNTMYRKWFLTPWKVNKVVMRPAAHFRDAFGSMFLNDLGGLPFWRVDIYGKALMEMKNEGKLYKEYKKIVGTQGTFTQAEIDVLSKGLKYGASMPEKILNLHQQIASPMGALFSAKETYFKLAKFIHNKEAGMSGVESALDAMKWTFNYNEITPFIAKVRTSPIGIPFITWQSKVIPIIAESMVKHPLRVAKWIGMFKYMQGYSLDQVGMSEEEFKELKGNMPDYIKNGWYTLMPWRDEAGQLKLMNLSWMFPGLGDIQEHIQKGEKNIFSAVMQSPLLALTTALQSERTYSGAPLYYDWEDPKSKAMKVLQLGWQLWSPSWSPGNTDWNTIWDAVQERPEALSPMEAAAANFGIRLTSVDEGVAKRRKLALERIHESEAKIWMKRELRKSISDEETEAIIEKYRKGMGTIRGTETE